MPSRMINVTDADIEKLLLLKFSGDKEGISISTFAMPTLLPPTFHTLPTIIAQVGEFFAAIFGAPLASAIMDSVRQLIDHHDKMLLPDITPDDIISLMNQKLYDIASFPAFDLLRPDNGLSLENNLWNLFNHNHNDSNILQLLNARRAAATTTSTGAASTNSTTRAKRPRGAAATSSSSAAPAAPNTRAKTAQQQAADKLLLQAWYETLFVANPPLRGHKLPCLHWLAKVAPCSNQPQCQKQSNKKDHVLDVVVTAHLPAILVWLKTDPLTRF